MSKKVSIPLWFDSNRMVDTVSPHRSVCFNSTLVRFKPKSCTCFRFPGYSFQFHSGSIQTMGIFIFLSGQQGFQFHSGSIQTLFDVLIRRRCKARFNSTLVRFKPPEKLNSKPFALVSIPLWFDSNEHEIAQSSARAKRFNSTLVRFKLFGITQRKVAEIVVSIPLWFDSNFKHLLAVKPICHSFNSTLVRFKLGVPQS